MTPHDLYLEAHKRGLRLEPHGDKLAVMPKGACPPDFADVLRSHKSVLLDWLNRPPCPGWGVVPPDDLPLVPVEPRSSPRDRERIINFLLRQGADQPGLLAAWMERRASSYYAGPGRAWDCASLAYASNRDAACWQLNRNERDVGELLEGTEQAAITPA